MMPTLENNGSASPRLLSPEMKADRKSSLKYDYIIVGGGGAGRVAAHHRHLACRLSPRERRENR